MQADLVQAERGVFEEVGELLLALARHGLGPPALDELADLDADGLEHLERLAVGRPHLAAEEFDAAADAPVDGDREPNRAVQPRLGGVAGAREVRVVEDVWNPRGP